MQNIALIFFLVMLVSVADTLVRRQLDPHAVYHADRCKFLNALFKIIHYLVLRLLCNWCSWSIRNCVLRRLFECWVNNGFTVDIG